MPPACSPFWGFHWLFGVFYVSTWWLGALLYFCEKHHWKLGRYCIHSGHCLRKNGHFNNTDSSILWAWDTFPFIGVMFIFFINVWKCSVCRSFSSDQFGCSVVSDSLYPHGLQHVRVPCPSPTSWTCSNSCPSSQWCHPTISSSVVPFFSYLSQHRGLFQ